MATKRCFLIAGRMDHYRWLPTRLVKRLLVAVLLCLLLPPLTLPSAFAENIAQPITRHPANDFYPSLSADGRFLSFVSDRSGNQDIWLRDLAPGSDGIPKQLSHHSTTDTAPAISPDGRRLLYVAYENDPRGDIQLLDLVTGKLKNLTDREYGQTAPVWGRNSNEIFYTRLASSSQQQAVIRHSLLDNTEEVLLAGASSCTASSQGDIVCAQAGKLHLLDLNNSQTKTIKISGSTLDSSPRFGNNNQLFFSRYQRDSSGDGNIDVEDNSAIWTATFSPSPPYMQNLYQLTAQGGFYLHPTAANGVLLYSDLLMGDVIKLDLRQFFAIYKNPSQAQTMAAAHFARGESWLGLQIMGNLVANPQQIAKKNLLLLKLEYLIKLREAKLFAQARQLIDQLASEGPRSRLLAAIHAISLNIHKQKPTLNRNDLQELVGKGVAKILALIEPHAKTRREYAQIIATAHMETSRLYLLLDDSIAALAQLAKLDSLAAPEIKAQALFSRGKVYRHLNNDQGLKILFLDVIETFGEESHWGARAIAETIAVSETGDNHKQKIASLRELTRDNPNLPRLGAATLIRIAEIYQENGEERKTITTLKEIGNKFPNLTHTIIKTLWWQGQILADLGEHEQAALVYGQLATMPAGIVNDAQKATDLMTIQRVKGAIKLRDAGDAKVAAKNLHEIIKQHPDSVAAHRAYINTKVMLGQKEDVFNLYSTLHKNSPDDPILAYAHGLTATYQDKVDFAAIIKQLQQVVEQRPDIAYFHQTLAWSHEQFERVSGNRGHLEQAAKHYQTALALIDPLQLPQLEADLLRNLGNVFHGLKNYSESMFFFNLWQQRNRPLTDPLLSSLLHRTFAESCFKSGAGSDAVVHYKTALKNVPANNKQLRLEILERLALSQQSIGDHTAAAENFSQALTENLALGLTKNLAILHRNIGANLQQAISNGNNSSATKRNALKQAVDSYLKSLAYLEQYGQQQQKTGKGLINMLLALTDQGSQAALGFDRKGEEKLLFGFIASAYQELEEPQAALLFYKKKLALYKQTAQTSPALLAEKAVTLNRSAILAFGLGELDYALENSLQSLALTKTLKLNYGIQSNLYNLSKIFLQLIETAQPISLAVLEQVVANFPDANWQKTAAKSYFFSLSNLAFTLAALPATIPTPHAGSKLEKSVGNWQRLFTLKSQAYSLYQQAEKALDSAIDFNSRELLDYGVRIKLNRLTIAAMAGKSAVTAELGNELELLLNSLWSPRGWIVDLVKAEHSSDKKIQAHHLDKAYATATAVPAATAPPDSSVVMAPFYARLIQLYADLPPESATHEQLFLRTETLQNRLSAIKIQEHLGRDFLLGGIPAEKQEKLKQVINELQLAIINNNSKKIAELRNSIDEYSFTALEEHMQAARFLTHMEPEAVTDQLSTVRPYLKFIAGTDKKHLFLHDGETLYHSTLSDDGKTIQGKQLKQALSLAKELYLSDQELQLRDLQTPDIDKLPTAHIHTLLDLLPSQTTQGLFFNRIAQAGPDRVAIADISSSNILGEIKLTGDGHEDSRLISKSHIVINNTPFSTMSITTGAKNRITERVELKNLYFPEGHTVFLLNPEGMTNNNRHLLATALLRSGFAHIIFAKGPLQPEELASTIKGYLQNLVRLPALTALNMAWQKGNKKSAPLPFYFYGSVGIDQEQMREQAAELFEAELRSANASDSVADRAAHLENALSLIEKADRNSWFAKISQRIVNDLFSLKDYKRATWHQKRLLATMEANTDSQQKITALQTLGILYSRQENYAEAVEYLQKAVALSTKTGNKKMATQGTTTLGIIKENQGVYDQALAAFDSSKEQLIQLGEQVAVADQLRRIGRIYHLRLSRYNRAREFFIQAYKIYNKQENLSGEAQALFEIGLTFEKTGDLQQAQHNYQLGQNIAEKLQDPVLLATGSLYQANVAWFTGEYQTAFKLLLSARQQADVAQEPNLQIQIANTRGLLYWTLNEEQKALLHLQKAVDLARSNPNLHAELASSLNNIGLIARKTGQLQSALDYFLEAEKIDDQRQSLWGLGYDNRNIGIVLLKMDRLQEAEERLQKAVAISAKIANPINQSKALLELGHLYKKQQQLTKASQHFTEALRLAQSLNLKEVIWRAAAGRGAVLWQQQEPTKAFKAFEMAIAVVESMRAALKVDQLRNSFQEDKQDLYRNMITLLVDMGQTELAFNYLERFRSRNFIDLLANQKIALKRPEDSRELQKVSLLYTQLDAMAQELAADSEASQGKKNLYKRKKAQAEEAQLELLQRNPELSAFIAVNPLNLSQFEKRLEPGVGAIAYLLTKNELFIWVSRNNGTIFKRVAVSETELTSTIQQYRDLMQNIEPVAATMRKLYGWLIKPVAKEIADLEYLGIIPYGPLYYLSFSALASDNGYLIEQQPIFYSPSASAMDYAFNKRKDKKRTRVLAIGNPYLGDLNYDLPLAEYEAGSIRWSFPDGDLLLGEKASKSWVMENISKYGIIHIAAHGDFQGINPLFSSLWLAAPDQQQGRLTVKEIFSMEINADLVTLSACQTGLGTLQGSELIGLNRAFLYAGTHALISSLWRVDDLATAVLMKHFYRNYVTMNKAQSLRQAQLMVKKNFPHPANWAGFNLLGDYK